MSEFAEGLNRQFAHVSRAIVHKPDQMRLQRPRRIATLVAKFAGTRYRRLANDRTAMLEPFDNPLAARLGGPLQARVDHREQVIRFVPRETGKDLPVACQIRPGQREDAWNG